MRETLGTCTTCGKDVVLVLDGHKTRAYNVGGGCSPHAHCNRHCAGLGYAHTHARRYADDAYTNF